MSETSRLEQASLARALVRRCVSGILSTQSLELPGYPFGSVTPYVVTPEGRIAIFVSRIAQHTKNMDADPRVCLTVVETPRPGVNPQALGRVSVIADARRAEGDEAAKSSERYFEFFPESRAFEGTHDFSVYLLQAVRVRHIAGFGRIFWVEAQDWAQPTPAWAAQQDSIIAHMNEDHGPALRAIAAAHGSSASDVSMLALDAEGFHVRAGGEVQYIPFPSPCRTSDEVRANMVRLARSAAPDGR